jgi:hypothetical protein
VEFVGAWKAAEGASLFRPTSAVPPLSIATIPASEAESATPIARHSDVLSVATEKCAREGDAGFAAGSP